MSKGEYRRLAAEHNFEIFRKGRPTWLGVMARRVAPMPRQIITGAIRDRHRSVMRGLVGKSMGVPHSRPAACRRQRIAGGV